MFTDRKSKRFPAFATVVMRNVFIGSALLKDISVSGCRIEHTMMIDVEKGKRYTLRIKPEPSANIKEFDLIAEARWVESRDCAFEAGFSVAVSPKGKAFKRYIDYITYRNSPKQQAAYYGLDPESARRPPAIPKDVALNPG
jgi:hypothetical protein